MEHFKWNGVERRATREAVHQEHHDFIKSLIEKEKRKQELWEKIQENVGSWAMIAILTFIVFASWESVVNFLRGKP